jgi:DNA-directed RNA polymerase sigma subunit (sigma70/sigma32)
MSTQHGKEKVRVMKRTQQQVRTKEEFDVLTPMEEKVVRMRYGLAVTDETPLTMLDEEPDLPADVAAQLRAMERRALEMRGQLRPMTAKEKIIATLKSKNRPE